MSEREYTSVIDSARFNIGQTLWFLDLESPSHYQLGEEYDSLIMEHPLFTFMRTPLKHIWRSSRALPKMEGDSFDNVISLLVSKIQIRSIVVESIERSENTGEFVYLDVEQEICLPEQVLYSSRKDAQRESTRILKMVRDWATAQLDSKNEMFSMRRSGSKQQSRCINHRARKTGNKEGANGTSSDLSMD